MLVCFRNVCVCGIKHSSQVPIHLVAQEVVKNGIIDTTLPDVPTEMIESPIKQDELVGVLGYEIFSIVFISVRASQQR